MGGYGTVWAAARVQQGPSKVYRWRIVGTKEGREFGIDFFILQRPIAFEMFLWY